MSGPPILRGHPLAAAPLGEQPNIIVYQEAPPANCQLNVGPALERANLKERRKDDYRRLVREWFDWNATMLPEIKESFTAGFSGRHLADHYGAKESNQEPDIPTRPED
jgi:hypothetical protein